MLRYCSSTSKVDARPRLPRLDVVGECPQQRDVLVELRVVVVARDEAHDRLLGAAR